MDFEIAKRGHVCFGDGFWLRFVYLECMGRFNDLDKQHNMIEEMPLRDFGFVEYSVIGIKHWELVFIPELSVWHQICALCQGSYLPVKV